MLKFESYGICIKSYYQAKLYLHFLSVFFFILYKLMSAAVQEYV